MENLLTTEQAAKFMGLAVTTLEKYRVYGSCPVFLKIGKRTVRYRVGDLTQWVESNTAKSTSDYETYQDINKKPKGRPRKPRTEGTNAQ